LFVFRERVGRVEVAFTSASHDGRPLNLALPGTPPAQVGDPVAGLAAVRAALGEPVVRGMSQVHGATVVAASAGGDGPAPEADGMVTDEVGTALLVRVADCVPVVLADVGRGVVGVAHAGRVGMAVGVVPATVAALRELGATELRAWVGPHVCGRCYEVPVAMRDEVAAAVPASWSETSWGTPALDVAAGVRAQLDAAAVPSTEVGGCTVEDPALWSHRRDGASAGRLAGLVQVVA